ncbi:MAG TPA: hypothetical protein PLU43_06765 [Lachnospiraceae bacterium]|nr:hypothetical protein [Lachnospiraceae bacterium]
MLKIPAQGSGTCLGVLYENTAYGGVNAAGESAQMLKGVVPP